MFMNMPARVIQGLAAAISVIIFVAAAERLKTLPRQTVSVEMQVALPLFVQVVMAAGDRFLAADIAAIRALVVATEKMNSDQYRILGKVQNDVAWLNPAHEDNYYTAAAILPWNGQVDAAQSVLARATQARLFDYQPAFFYAFNLLHFKGDAAGASAWMRTAAEHLPEGDDRLQMNNLAAIWMDKAEDIDLAIGVVQAMSRQAKRRDFRIYLEQRVVRLQALKELRIAAQSYQQRFERPLTQLDDLVRSGIVVALPKDPFDFGFDIDRQGKIVLRSSPSRP